MTIKAMMLTVATININATTPPTIAFLTREDWKVLATCGLDVTPLPALVLADTCIM